MGEMCKTNTWGWRALNSKSRMFLCFSKSYNATTWFGKPGTLNTSRLCGPSVCFKSGAICLKQLLVCLIRPTEPTDLTSPPTKRNTWPLAILSSPGYCRGTVTLIHTLGNITGWSVSVWQGEGGVQRETCINPRRRKVRKPRCPDWQNSRLIHGSWGMGTYGQKQQKLQERGSRGQIWQRYVHTGASRDADGLTCARPPSLGHFPSYHSGRGQPGKDQESHPSSGPPSLQSLPTSPG